MENGTWRISGGGERTEQAVADFRIAFAREVGTGSGIGGSGRKYQTRLPARSSSGYRFPG